MHYEDCRAHRFYLIILITPDHQSSQNDWIIHMKVIRCMCGTEELYNGLGSKTLLGFMSRVRGCQAEQATI
jgi:hypothetical protein